MFVDASAMVAILTREPEADALADALERAEQPVTSAIAIFEAALGVARKRRSRIAEARDDVLQLLETSGIRTVALTHQDAEGALDAFERFGKGRGHPAQLKLGDCFAYAAARRHGSALLFKGEDFAHTDIASGLAAR